MLSTEFSHCEVERGHILEDGKRGLVEASSNLLVTKTLDVLARSRSLSPHRNAAAAMKTWKSEPSVQMSRGEYNRHIGNILMEDMGKPSGNNVFADHNLLDDLLNCAKTGNIFPSSKCSSREGKEAHQIECVQN